MPKGPNEELKDPLPGIDDRVVTGGDVYRPVLPGAPQLIRAGFRGQLITAAKKMGLAVPLGQFVHDGQCWVFTPADAPFERIVLNQGDGFSRKFGRGCGLPNEGHISRTHFSATPRDKNLEIADLRSRNGTCFAFIPEDDSFLPLDRYFLQDSRGYRLMEALRKDS